MSPYDEDCFCIFMTAYYYESVAMYPRCSDIAQTDVYKRGEEIRDLRYGPPIPVHLDPELKRMFSPELNEIFHARLEFKGIHGREPRQGDILRYEEVKKRHDPRIYQKEFRLFREAWARRLPEFPCPMKFENEKRYVRTYPSATKEVWEEEGFRHTDPRWVWLEVEAEALGTYDVPRPPEPPSIRAVTFLEDEHGNWHTKPLSTSKSPV